MSYHPLKEDSHRRPWALVKEVRGGDFLECDGGFTCLNEGSVKQVRIGVHGLYIPCREGEHYLDGQIEGRGSKSYYIGFYKVEEPKP